MKKALSLILALVMCLSLCACGEEEKEPTTTLLSTDNVKDYLSFQATVTECEVNEEEGFLYNDYDGTAKVRLSVVNQGDAKFESVRLTLKLSTKVSCITGPVPYGWEFRVGNKQTGTEPHTDVNYKTVEIVLPNDGNWEETFDLKLALYGDQYRFAPSKLNDCSIEVVSVVGTVIS